MANQFAAEMILPSDVVFLYANGDYSLVRMAQLFNVSEQAMRIRLERLGILWTILHSCGPPSPAGFVHPSFS